MNMSCDEKVVHPELRSGEILLGNFDIWFIKKVLRWRWKTLRVGITAYDKDGAAYPKAILPHLRPIPVFVALEEKLAHEKKLYESESVNIPQ